MKLMQCYSVQVNEGKYPVLSSLARDYLAISATACPVERSFSSSADVWSQDQMALKPRTIERSVGGLLWSVQGVKMKGKFSMAEEIMADCMVKDKAARERRG